MKKRRTAIAAVIGMLCAVCLVFAGCTALRGYGPDDSFPYDAAVLNGYVGTEGQWMAEQDTPSTIYRRMYEEVRADGSFSGTYMEFLKELGLEGDDTPYINRALNSVVQVRAVFGSGSILSSDFASRGSGSFLPYGFDRANGDAYILTNFHIIYSPDSSGTEAVSHISDNITVYLYGDSTESTPLKATYYGGAMNYDLAVLRIEGDDVVTSSGSGSYSNRDVLAASSALPATIGDSDSLLTGERVYVVGNANGEGIAVAGGVLSMNVDYSNIRAADEKTVLNLLEMRVDAAVNHGNSGGALLNGAGEIVGVVNARSEEEELQGFNFAIPINRAMAVVRNIFDNGGRVYVANVGATFSVDSCKSVYDETTAKTYLEDKVVVSKLERGPGFESGLDVGDTVVAATVKHAAGGEEKVAVTRLHKLIDTLIDVRVGDTLSLEVTRQGTEGTVTVNISYASASRFRTIS